MGHYKSNLRDLEFNLFEVFGAGERMGTGPYEEMDPDTARGILEEVNRLSEGPLAESFAESDRVPPIYDPATKTVVMPEAAIWASCACTAATAFQRTPGRGA